MKFRVRVQFRAATNDLSLPLSIIYDWIERSVGLCW